MKNNRFLAIFIILMIAAGCNQKSLTKMDENLVDNNYPTAGAALDYVKSNLHLILNEAQIRSYNLGSEEQIKNLVITNDLPLILLPMDQLNDTIVSSVSEARIYTLGEERNPKISVVVRNPTGKSWIVGTIGLKKYIESIANQPDLTAVVEVTGLEISLLEIQSGSEKVYKPIVDYPEADIYQDKVYRVPELFRQLEAYRLGLEKQFGKVFSSGNLEK